MRIFRATSVMALDYIKDKLRPVDGVGVEQYLQNLSAWMKEAPQTVFLLTAFEKEELKGFLIAYLPPGVSFAFISQVWAEDNSIATGLLQRVIGWADSCMRTQLRMESESDHDQYSALWGFRTITETRALNLEDSYGSTSNNSQAEDTKTGEGVVESPAAGSTSNT